MRVWQAGVLFAVFATIVGTTEASTRVTESAQAKIDAMDKQFWGEGVDQEATQPVTEDVMNDVEEQALQKAGFTVQQQQQQHRGRQGAARMEQVGANAAVASQAAMAGRLE